MQTAKVSLFCATFGTMLLVAGCLAPGQAPIETPQGDSPVEETSGDESRLLIDSYQRLGQLVVDHRPSSQKLADSLHVQGEFDHVAIITQRITPIPLYGDGTVPPTPEVRLKRDGIVVQSWPTVGAGGGGAGTARTPWPINLGFLHQPFAPALWEEIGAPGNREYVTVSTLYGVHGSVGKPQDLQRTIGSDCRVMAATVTGPRASFPISLPSDMWTEPTVVFFRAEALSCADNETTGAAGLRLLLGSVGVESPSQLDRPAGYSKYLVEMITNDARILDVYAGSDHVGRLGNLEIVHRGSAYGFQATVEGRFAYSFEAEAHGSAPCSGIIRAAPILREAAPGIAKILRPALAPGPCEGVQVAGTLEASDATLLGRWGFNRAPSVGAWTGSGPDVLISTWTENYIPDPPAVMP